MIVATSMPELVEAVDLDRSDTREHLASAEALLAAVSRRVG
jgi:hypothetical protein